ncbi:MAG TPA: oxygen-independent coproporphyrinogen III oxidase-like protein [Methylophilaceae bacterium]|jgi:oxygen-independent coproporphyrinogen-3 oxidase|nr:oxygen-independent coproporphyrinogen III oxidase-like protein [Methylophilaceae bacterium]
MIPIIPIADIASLNSPAPVSGGQTISGLRNSPPLSLYIHIPWCVKKCPYCDFNSHEGRADIPEQQYVKALITDLEQSVPRVYGRKVRSVFFGGGTPSLFSPESINEILNAVNMLTPLEFDAEVTLEANPGAVDTAHFEGYKQAGVNRVSLGIQSFNNDHLSALGRIHDSKQAIMATELALNTFDRVNLDVMYGLPKQSLSDALLDAKQALAFGSDHLSFYHLTLEPNTAFYHTPPSLPDDDASSEMQERIEALLAENGYQHYETSAFCKPKSQARHNINYWSFGDYLGIGAGAHSKLSYHDKITREVRHKHPKAFMSNAEAGSVVDQMWSIPQKDFGFEFMMNALRLIHGFDIDLFQERTGLPLITLKRQLAEAADKGLLVQGQGRIKPTLLGQRFLNDLLTIFLD